MKITILELLCSCLLFQLCSTHICLLSPPQRGSMLGINDAAADDCALIIGPCGERPASNNTIYLPSGQDYTVSIQKNLNHWGDGSNPGNLIVSLSSDESEFIELARVPDMGEDSLHVYSINVTMPMVETGIARFTLQAKYVTNRTPVFYQCSDIGIYNPEE